MHTMALMTAIKIWTPLKRTMNLALWAHGRFWLRRSHERAHKLSKLATNFRTAAAENSRKADSRRCNHRYRTTSLKELTETVTKKLEIQQQEEKGDKAIFPRIFTRLREGQILTKDESRRASRDAATKRTGPPRKPWAQEASQTWSAEVVDISPTSLYEAIIAVGFGLLGFLRHPPSRLTGTP